MNQRVRVEVRGIVQGVGFRPFIYRLAHRFGLSGTVLNFQGGVSIEVQGNEDDVSSFLRVLPLEAPPLARIDEMSNSPLELREESGFRILKSMSLSAADTLISPDIATCEDCVRELLDQNDRRYCYAFLNCTNCGPRFTIVRGVPYDRARTSMASFSMCAACQGEYDDPLNRRFHAQPNACRDCGPQLVLVDRTGVTQSGDPLSETVRLLAEGLIVAIKGLGGFHLAVDAYQPAAVAELRRRKGRGDKPFAVMLKDRSAAEAICWITDADAAALESPQRPIVLLLRREDALRSLAPDCDRLGVFLPYTPLHHLLFADTCLEALVMTSANLSEEPIAIGNDEAIARLGGVADFLLLHNRDILLRCDDSVVECLSGRTQFVRRSRGYVPSPILLKDTMPAILAVGGELKNAICISRGRYAFPGQHIGDLEGLSAYDFFKESIQHFEEILEVKPETIAHDLHPGYFSTQWAVAQLGLRTIGVQHHHAHIAACMAENQLTDSAIGIALDGTGYGVDGAVWGGEVLIASLKSFTRAAHFAYTPMPGGSQAIHEPWRMAVSYLLQSFGEDWRARAPVSASWEIPESHVSLVEKMIRAGINSPLTSSCGRLFDAVAFLALGRVKVSYEAQAAIALEACCDPRTSLGTYNFDLVEPANENSCLQIGTNPLFVAIARDLQDSVAPSIISRRFHDGLAEVLTKVAIRTAERTGLNRVCLSGGVFLNTILSEALEGRLSSAGLQVFTHTQVSPGDGGLSLGQLVVAASQISPEKEMPPAKRL